MVFVSTKRTKIAAFEIRKEDPMARTDENLEKAYEDECKTYMKYLAFARQAEDEGLPNIARLFRATAEGETITPPIRSRPSEGFSRPRRI